MSLRERLSLLLIQRIGIIPIGYRYAIAYKNTHSLTVCRMKRTSDLQYVLSRSYKVDVYYVQHRK